MAATEIPADPFGIGILDNGALLIIPPGELKARIAARDLDEADDPGDDELAAEYGRLLEPETTPTTDDEFKEGDHPRAPDGRFGTTSGEHGGAEPTAAAPAATPEEASATHTAGARTRTFATKKDHAAHLLKNGVTTQEMLAALRWPSISMPAMAKSLNMRLEKVKEGRVTKYVGVPLGPAGQPDKTHSLLSLIASRGGIRADDGNIGDIRSSIGSGNKFMPGYGQLIRTPKQMSTAAIMGGKHAPMKIDAAREMAADMGYIPENTTLPEFLDFLDREFRGEKIYPIGYVPPGIPDDPAELEKARDDFVSDLSSAIKESGGANLTDKELDRAVALWQHEGIKDPIDIIERLALEADDDETAKGGPERSQPVDGWDVHDDEF